MSDVAQVSTNEGASGHVVIVGCGRVGSGLAGRLLSLGHSVAVIDTNRSSFRRLAGLDAEQIEGIGYDRATLRSAGVERAVALAAVTNGDNSNIVVARTGREAFGVKRVFARIYDMRRAAVYERLGIPTVASARLTIDMSMRQLRPDVEAVRWVDPGAGVCLVERPAPRALIGTSLGDLEADGTVRLAAVRRLGVSILPMPDLVVQDGDLLYLMVANDRVDGLQAEWADASDPKGTS
ncbi:MAG TPA: TrkA family potassium uptake protein [Ilumatobacteraceae bacterium]|nr:TrkA family potassium uptake protein [Ilumatobacteraceae bacterium]